MLEAIELECSRGFRTLFAGLSFQAATGELLHVAGPNGSGKTSLLRILCGLLDADRGIVQWKGAPARGLGEAFRRELVYIGHANALKDELTCAENLRVACRLSGIAFTEAEIGGTLEAFGLDRYRDAAAKTLSQGQRRRVTLARLALASGRPLWLLDEPWNALDEAATAHVQKLVDAHLARSGLVVMTSHQPPQSSSTTVVRTLALAGSGS